MNDHETCKEKMSEQLKEWSAQINLLEARAEKVGADMKAKHAEEMRDLREKQRVASKKLRELSNATGDAWDEVKATADNVWEDLKTGLITAHSKFK